MKKRWNKTTRVRTLTIESLDPRLCLAAGLGWAGVGEIQVDNAGAHVSHWHNPTRPHDVNQDRSVTPIDALLVVNTLNAGGARTLSAAEGEATALVDVNGDSQVTPADCLAVVNELNQDTVVGVTADETPSDDPSGDEVPADDGSVSDRKSSMKEPSTTALSTTGQSMTGRVDECAAGRAWLWRFARVSDCRFVRSRRCG